MARTWQFFYIYLNISWLSLLCGVKQHCIKVIDSLAQVSSNLLFGTRCGCPTQLVLLFFYKIALNLLFSSPTQSYLLEYDTGRRYCLWNTSPTFSREGKSFVARCIVCLYKFEQFDIVVIKTVMITRLATYI